MATKIRTHWHLCPKCHKAFECVGPKCGHLHGIPHWQCMPGNRFARLTKPVSKPQHNIH